MRTHRVFALALAVLLVSSVALAQVSTSRISGTITDKTGGVVPGAKVTATNEATNISQTATTTESGTYSFASLPVGNYTITVEAQGFQKYVSRKNVVTVGEPTVLDVTMEVGAVTSVVEVEGSYEKLATSNASMGGVVSRKEIVELPLNGRNPLNLLGLEAGLIQRSTGAAGSGTHVFGSRDRAHNVTIDGIDANESSVPNPQSNLYRLTPDNVQEYRVTTQNATPEFGRNSGANVTVATRSGTNSLHGNVFYFHRNTALNTNEFYNNANYDVCESSGRAGCEQTFGRPILLLHQFGGDIGGPVIKDKTFFFFSYQGNKIKQTQPISQSFGTPTVYTGSARQGLFRFVRGAITVGSQTYTRNNPGLVDTQGNLLASVPLCGGAVTTNCVDTYNIPASDPTLLGLDPDMNAMLTSFPVPNNFSSGDGLNTGNYLWNTPSRFTGPFYMARIDHQFNANHSIFARALWSNYNTTGGDLLNSRPAVFPGFNPLGTVDRGTQNVALVLRSVLSPRVVNDFTVGYSRFDYFFGLLEANQVTGINALIGQECFGTDSLSNVDSAFCNTPHTARVVSNIQLIDNLSWTVKNHMIRGGFNMRFYRHNDSRGVPGGFNMSPTMVFAQGTRSPYLTQTAPTANCPPAPASCTFPTVPGGVGSGAGQIDNTDDANLRQAIVELAGIPAQINQVYQADLANDVYRAELFVLGTRIKHINFYLQDEWKIKRNLTLTYGLRWEWNQPAKDCCDRVFVPDRPVTSWTATTPVTFVKAESWWGRDNVNALAPRVSIAWQPFNWHRTVVRAGWGIAFDTLSTFQATSIGGKVPGSSLQCNIRVNDAVSTSCPPLDIADFSRLRDLRTFTSFGIPTAAPSTRFSPAPASSGTAPGVGAFDPNLKTPTVHQWNLTIQQEVPWGFVVELGYVGRKGNRLYRAYDINQIKAPQPFVDAMALARQNRVNGCDADGTVAGSSTAACATAAGVPTLLVSIFGTSDLNSSTVATMLDRFGVGDLGARADANRFSSLPSPDYFRPNPQFNDIFYFDSGGSSIYHGGVLSVSRRFQQGLTLRFSYTYSKSIDDMSVDPVASTSGGGLSTTNSRTPTDVRNFGLDRARSDFDNKHVLVGNFLYELPFGKGRKWANNPPAALDHIIGGWTVTGIFLRMSGEPFTINSGVRSISNTRQTRAEIRGPMIQPSIQASLIPTVLGPVVWNATDLDQVLTSPTYGCRNILQPDGTATQTYFCFPGAMQAGSNRNAADGIPFWNVDMGLLKNFSVTERVRLQFRVEFFNLLNHTNFDNPRNASTGSPTITSSVFGQSCCVATAIPSSTTVIANGEANRVIQFGLKLSF